MQPAPRDRFRCLVCQRFVRATDFGVCPHCGKAPPALSVRFQREVVTPCPPWALIGAATVAVVLLLFLLG
jgi:hypothetical protein